MVRLRDHQDVRRRLGVEIPERQRELVLTDHGRREVARDDRAEQAIGHGGDRTGKRTRAGERPGYVTTAAAGQLGLAAETTMVPVLSRPEARLSADDAVTALYLAHYRGLVRLAALLLDDAGAAEEVVQDAYVRMHGS